MTAIKVKTKGVIRRDPATETEALLSAFDSLVDSLGANIQLDAETEKRLNQMREDSNAKKAKKL